MEKILAIDFGTKRVGLAISLGTLAEPLKVIANKTAVEEIKAICQEKKIERLVLGMSEAAMAEQTKDFAVLLQAAIDLPIDLVDETLSSREVARKLKEANFPLRKRQGPIDHFAAALILEQWLELH